MAAEEFGLILCVVVMALYLTVVVRSLLRLVRERDPFIRLAGTGLAVLLGMQAMINIGVAVRLLPAKGMTLPLISYGGSSLIAAGLGLGVLLAMTRKRPQHDIDDILGSARDADIRGRPLTAPLLVIAAGGTGGHMFPAQALAEEMLARGWRVRLATDARGARYASGFPPEVERRATAAATFAQGRCVDSGDGAVRHRRRHCGDVAGHAPRPAGLRRGLWRLSGAPGDAGGAAAQGADPDS